MKAGYSASNTGTKIALNVEPFQRVGRAVVKLCFSTFLFRV